MILTDIEKVLANPLHGDDIKNGIRIQDDHKIHVTGEGYISTLADIIGSERAINYGQRELKEPATKFLTKKIKDELSRWKNNQGTRKTYDFGDSKELSNEFRKTLTSVWKSGSIDDFARWANDALYTDFGGFAIVERGRMVEGAQIRDGIPSKISKNTPYIIFKALEDVHDFQLNGRKVEYIILKFGTVIRQKVDRSGVVRDVETKLFRVIDDSQDVIYEMDEDGMRESEEYEVIPNRLGFVPAIQLSDIRETPLNDHVKTSHISQTMPILQDYLTRHAEHVVSELLHASPLLALKGTKCTYESPDGIKCSNGKIWEGGREKNCPVCKGVGATVPKNASEIIIVPELDKDGKTYNPSMIGQYITPPVEVLSHQTKELDILEQRAVYSGTGIKAMVKSNIQTATETILNLKPLEDKISSVLDNIEVVEKFVTDVIGRMVHGDKYKGCEVHYGRRLNVREENIILNEIEQSKRAGLPESEIRLLLQELMATRYRNSNADLERAFMLLDLEPLATQSVKDVIESVYVDEITKKVKQNFDDLIDWFENTYGSVHLYKSGMDMNKRVDSIRKKIYKRAEKVQIQETDEDD